MRNGESRFRNVQAKSFSVAINYPSEPLPSKIYPKIKYFESKEGFGLSPQKGAEHAVDDMCHSLNFVAAGIGQWLHDWRICSRPASHRHRRGAGPSYSGTKMMVRIWTLAGEGEVFEKEVGSRS
jgi:hypothetical protein